MQRSANTRALLGGALAIALVVVPSCTSALRAAPADADVLLIDAAALAAPRVEDVTVFDLLAEYLGVTLASRPSRAETLSAEDVQELLESSGLAVIVFHGTLDHEVTGLYHHLDLGRPLLILLGEANDRIWGLAVGYDADPEILILADPSLGLVGIERETLRASWEPGGAVTVLAWQDAENATME